MKRMTAPLSIATALCLTLFGGGATAAWAADPPKPVAAAPKAAGGSDEIPKLDIGGMLPSEVDSLRKLLKKFPSPCGKPHSLLVSLQTDAKCGLSLVAAKYLQKMLADGFLESEAEEKYSARFVNVPCEDINIGDAAVARFCMSALISRGKIGARASSLSAPSPCAVIVFASQAWQIPSNITKTQQPRMAFVLSLWSTSEEENDGWLMKCSCARRRCA